VVLPAIGIGLTCTLGVAAWFLAPVLSVGVGHKAKVLCSGVFVSKRTPTAVLADLQADDLSILKCVHASIDSVQQTVTARALGVERRATYRDGLGCAIGLDNLTPPQLPGSDRGLAVLTGSTNTRRLTPTERSVASDPTGQLDAVVARAFEEPRTRGTLDERVPSW
jgi:hypothetical protein